MGGGCFTYIPEGFFYKKRITVIFSSKSTLKMMSLRKTPETKKFVRYLARICCKTIALKEAKQSNIKGIVSRDWKGL
jgi:hypothetical protein